MSKVSKDLTTLLSSGTGIICIAIVVIGLNFILGYVHLRADFTHDKLYTLADGSKKILKNLESKVVLRFYCTKSTNDMPVHLKSYASRVEDLLKEYKIAGGGKIKVEKYNPLPDSDDADKAQLDGIEGFQVSLTSEPLYFGLAINCIDATMALPRLEPSSENSLEYNITRAIYRVANPERKTIGVMSAYPIMGMPGGGSQFGMPQQQGKPPWAFVTELKRDYDVREVQLTADSIPDDIKTLVLVHPKEISDKTQFAIDQFIMRGGNLIAFVDPFSAWDEQNKLPQAPGQPQFAQNSSSLDKLFDAWGIGFATDKVVADMNYAFEQRQRSGASTLMPPVLDLDRRALNADQIITGGLDRMFIAYAGAFTGDPINENVTKTVLINSSSETQLVDSFKVRFGGPTGITKDFESDDTEYALAVRLIGKFKTAFPDGPPSDDASDVSEDGEKTDDSLKEAEETSAVILIGDTDMIFDDFWLRKVNFFGQTVMSLLSDNNNLLQNAVEQLSGDTNLISIRSRTITHRPFEKVRAKQREAEEEYKAEIAGLEEELEKTRTEIRKLQQRPEDDQDQRIVRSREQEEALKKWQGKQVKFRKNLKELRKNLRRDIDKIETTAQWCNIALIPALVCLTGIGLGFSRRRRASGS